MIVSFKGLILEDEAKVFQGKDGKSQKVRKLLVHLEGSRTSIDVKVPENYQVKKNSLHEFKDVDLNFWEMNGRKGYTFKIE